MLSAQGRIEGIPIPETRRGEVVASMRRHKVTPH
jgi:hypothetical protein